MHAHRRCLPSQRCVAVSGQARAGQRGGAPGGFLGFLGKPKNPENPGLSVYVGDSPSDLAPLLAADLGIVVGRNALLRRAAAAAGVRMRPLLAAGAPVLSIRPKT